MTSEFNIRGEIERIVSYYDIWTIGKTDDASRSRMEHGNPVVWHCWHADSEMVARNIEKHFLDRGMTGAPGDGGHGDFAYIFMS